jgi:signal transduction histidine kinase
MEPRTDPYGYDSLAFFGRVNASISHELKNVMAIISETAGLLNDLSEIARQGTAVEPDMLASSTASIIEEVQRGFTTIRQMNRFSHSIDTPAGVIDLVEMLDLIRHLAGYLAFAGKMNLNPGDGDAPIVHSSPFILQTLVYQAVVQAFQEAGPEAELDISVQPGGDSNWRILIEGFSAKAFTAFYDERIDRMATSIDLSIQRDPATNRLEINIPIAVEGLASRSGGPETSAAVSR